MGRAHFSPTSSDRVPASAFNDDEAFWAVLQLERAMLDHRPASPREAVAILDVIIPDVAAGGRSDGRDVSALANIRAMLSTL